MTNNNIKETSIRFITEIYCLVNLHNYRILKQYPANIARTAALTKSAFVTLREPHPLFYQQAYPFPLDHAPDKSRNRTMKKSMRDDESEN